VRFWRRYRIVLAVGGALFLGLSAGLSAVAGRRWQLRVRSGAYDPLIHEAALRHGLAPGLVKAVIWKESRFRPYTIGRAKEVGLMQITAGAVTDWHDWSGGAMPTRHMCFDPGLNIEIGTWYLARAMRTWQEYRSADILALAEYNAGGSRARRWAPANPQQELQLTAVRLSSTRDYITQVRRKWYDLEQKRLSHG
jgi:soluble lytic murein transglycosylase